MLVAVAKHAWVIWIFLLWLYLSLRDLYFKIFLMTFLFSKEDRTGSEFRNRGLRTTEVGFGFVPYARVDRLLLVSHQRHQIYWQGNSGFRITQYQKTLTMSDPKKCAINFCSYNRLVLFLLENVYKFYFDCYYNE